MIYVVTRHVGAIEWIARKGFEGATLVSHLDGETIANLNEGDVVIGVLPIHIAAQVCDRGASFYALTINVPPEMRGRELSADDMESLGASIQQFEVRCVPN